MAGGYTNSQMATLMKDFFRMEEDKVEEIMRGKMAINIMAIGKEIRWTAMVN